MKKLFIILLLFPLVLVANSQDSVAVVIVGGGPAGLSSAIEAAIRGCDVTIIEKRDKYVRSQVVVLAADSIRTLNRLGVVVPEISVGIKTSGRQLWGGERIRLLEKRLAKRCEELGVKRIHGEFIGLGEERTIYVKALEEEFSIPYDILIAADGLHSKTRDALSIEVEQFGSAKGAYICIPDLLTGGDGVERSKILRDGDDFIRVMKGHSILKIVLIQSPFEATEKQVKELLKAKGHKRDLQALNQGYGFELQENIPIVLAKAKTFCSPKRSAIVLGDAALSLSFLRADGFNTILASTEVLGRFLEEFSVNRESAFQSFNSEMESLIEVPFLRSAELLAN